MTKTATKPEAAPDVDELAELRAQLEAQRAENAALKEALEKKAASGRKAQEFPADRLADENTVLGRVQRIADRSAVYDAVQKLYRAMGYPETCEAVVSLAEQATQAEGNAFHGKSVDEVVTAVTTRTSKPRKEKAPAVVGDATAS